MIGSLVQILIILSTSKFPHHKKKKLLAAKSKIHHQMILFGVKMVVCLQIGPI